jgi:hypothetical protein
MIINNNDNNNNNHNNNNIDNDDDNGDNNDGNDNNNNDDNHILAFPKPHVPSNAAISIKKCLISLLINYLISTIHVSMSISI